jgi:quercetin dioxygenase-like cupin family protein
MGNRSSHVNNRYNKKILYWREAMREVRIFELEHDEPASAWRVAQPSIFKVIAGEIWLTVEGDSEDHWLQAGESIELPGRAVAWISASQSGARFALASGSEYTTARPKSGLPALGWLPRWLGVA